MESDADWTQSASADFGGYGFVGKHREGKKGKHNAASGRIGGNKESSRPWTAPAKATPPASKQQSTSRSAPPAAPRYSGPDRRAGGSERRS